MLIPKVLEATARKLTEAQEHRLVYDVIFFTKEANIDSGIQALLTHI